MPNPPHHNESSGSPENQLQFRDIKGDINFNQYIHSPEPPDSPRQVPKPDRRFTNRTAEFEQFGAIVRSTVAEGRGATVVLLGDEGVGKSVTLAEIAHRFRDSFPDGVLRRDLGQWRDGRGNLDHVAVQKSLLADLHAERVTGGTRADQLLTATVGLGVLLLLDGVASSAELEAFSLGSGPHMVAATGLLHLARDEGVLGGDLDVIDLGALAPDDSMALLRTFPRVGRRLTDPGEHASARSLVEICGNLPAAVQMAARHMERQDLSVTELVGALEPRMATVPPTTGVDAVIDLALSGLGETEYNVLDLLSAYPGRSVPGDLGRVALGESAARARAHLEESGLLHPGDDLETGVVELVRARVRSRVGGARAGERTEDNDRERVNSEAIVRYVLLTHHWADRMSLGERLRLVDVLDTDSFTLPPTDYRPPFSDRQEAAEWQDRSLSVVPTILRLALTWFGPVAVYVLAESVWPVCFGGGRTAIGTQIYTYALQVARSNGHHRARLRLACYLARLWREAGQGERAAEALAEAEEAGETAENSGDLDTAVLYETRALLMRNFPGLVGDGQGTSDDLIARARGLHRKHGRSRGEAMQSYQLGDGARERGDLDRAEQELTGARQIAERRIGELEREGRGAPLGALDDWHLLRAKILFAQAKVGFQRGEPDPAEYEAGQAQKVFWKYLETVRWVRAMHLLAELSELRGMPDEARERLREADCVARYYRLDDQIRGILHHWERLSRDEDPRGR